MTNNLEIELICCHYWSVGFYIKISRCQTIVEISLL